MTKPAIIVINDQLSDCLSAQDRGVFYGDGVFETLRFEQGDVCLWPYHYERLLQGLQRLRIAFDERLLKQHIALLLSAIDKKNLRKASGIIKLIVTRGEGGRGYRPPEVHQATLLSYFYPIDSQQQEDMHIQQRRGITVMCCDTTLPVNPLLAGIKSLNQLSYVVAACELDNNVQDGLLFTSDGYLVESISRNVFIVKDKQLLTPTLCQTGVAGTMRRLIIERVAPSLHLSVHELPINKETLMTADEVFLCGSVARILPVVKCDNSAWDIGKITQRLQAETDRILSSGLRCSLSHFV